MIVEPLGDHRIPSRIRISWFEPPVSVRFGDIWRFELRLRRPRGSRNAGVFDYEAWLFRNRIGGTGYVVEGRRNYRVRSGALGVVDRIEEVYAGLFVTSVLGIVLISGDRGREANETLGGQIVKPRQSGCSTLGNAVGADAHTAGKMIRGTH